jgi:uncharacterized protein (DUF305 family)
MNAIHRPIGNRKVHSLVMAGLLSMLVVMAGCRTDDRRTTNEGLATAPADTAYMQDRNRMDGVYTDDRFVDQMIRHEQETLQMAMAVRDQAQQPQVRNMASDLVETHQENLRRLEQRRTGTTGQQTYGQPGATTGQQPGVQNQQQDRGAQASQQPYAQPGQQQDGRQYGDAPGQQAQRGMEGQHPRAGMGMQPGMAEHHYLTRMIPHQAEGIITASQAMTRSADPQIREIAGEIVQSNAESIQRMQDLLERHFADVMGPQAQPGMNGQTSPGVGQQTPPTQNQQRQPGGQTSPEQ